MPARNKKRKKKVPRPVQLMIPFPVYPAVGTNHDLASSLNEGGRRYPLGSCYRNCIMCLLHLADELGPDVLIEYVEGWLIMNDGTYPIEHGWLEVNQEVVDVTLPDKQEAKDYYAVYRFSFEQCQEMIIEYDGELPLFSLTEAGMEEMRQAFEQLPLNKETAIAWACLGYMKTGFKSVIIPEGVILDRR